MVANFLSVNGLCSRPNRPSAAATSVPHRSLEDLSRNAKDVCREVRALWMSMICSTSQTQKQNRRTGDFIHSTSPIQKLMSWGSHGRFEYRLLPAITATAAERADGGLWSSLAASNDFHRCVGWTSPRKPWSLHHQQWSGSLGCSGFKLHSLFARSTKKSKDNTHPLTELTHVCRILQNCSLYLFFILLPGPS